MPQPPRTLSPISEALQGLVCEAARQSGADDLERLRLVWTAVVGPEVAAATRPVDCGLSAGWIAITARSAAWRDALVADTTRLVARLRRFAPSIRRITVRIDPTLPPPSRPAPPPPEPAVELTPETEGIPDLELRRAFEGLRAAVAERARQARQADAMSPRAAR